MATAVFVKRVVVLRELPRPPVASPHLYILRTVSAVHLVVVWLQCVNLGVI